MEHTDDRQVARKIALDHLAEDEFYYTKLKAFETEMKLNARGKKEDKKEIEDYLKRKEKNELGDQMRELTDKDVKEWKKENTIVYEEIKKMISEVLKERKK